MPLGLTDEHQSGIDELSAELRAAAEAIGLGLAGQLTKLHPALARTPDGESVDDGAAILGELDLDHEGAPDALTLAACLAAHRAYVRSRGSPDGVSAGALALSRLLVWLQRAAMLGPAPTLVWIGPAPRCPEPGAGQHRLSARCALRLGDAERRAEAASVIGERASSDPGPGAQSDGGPL